MNYSWEKETRVTRPVMHMTLNSKLGQSYREDNNLPFRENVSVCVIWECVWEAVCFCINCVLQCSQPEVLHNHLLLCIWSAYKQPSNGLFSQSSCKHIYKQICCKSAYATSNFFFFISQAVEWASEEVKSAKAWFSWGCTAWSNNICQMTVLQYCPQRRFGLLGWNKTLYMTWKCLLCDHLFRLTQTLGQIKYSSKSTDFLLKYTYFHIFLE